MAAASRTRKRRYYVISKAVVSAHDENFRFIDTTTVTGVAAGSATQQLNGFEKKAKVQGTAVISAVENYFRPVPGTVTGVAVISAEVGGFWADSATVTGTAVASATDVHTYALLASSTTGVAVISATVANGTVDAATVIGKAVISATELRERITAGLVIGLGLPRSDESAIFNDAASVIAAAVISSTDTRTYITEPGTATGLTVLSAVEQRGFSDAGTVVGIGVVLESTREDAGSVIGVAIVSAVDTMQAVNSGTAIGVGVPSAEIFGVENGLVTGVAIASAVQTLAGVASGTVTGVAVIDSIDDNQFSGIVTGVAVISGLAGYNTIDAGTVTGVADVSLSVDEYIANIELGQVTGVAIVSALDVLYADAATVIGVGVPSGKITYDDAATVTGTAFIITGEVYTPSSYTLHYADPFTTDTTGNYVFDQGEGTIGVASGRLTPVSNWEKRQIYAGLSMVDSDIKLKYTLAGSPSGTVGTIIKRIDASNFLFALTNLQTQSVTLWKCADGVIARLA